MGQNLSILHPIICNCLKNIMIYALLVNFLTQYSSINLLRIVNLDTLILFNSHMSFQIVQLIVQLILHQACCTSIYFEEECWDSRSPIPTLESFSIHIQAKNVSQALSSVSPATHVLQWVRLLENASFIGAPSSCAHISRPNLPNGLHLPIPLTESLK